MIDLTSPKLSRASDGKITFQNPDVIKLKKIATLISNKANYMTGRQLAEVWEGVQSFGLLGEKLKHLNN